ncbi:MAG: FMN-binding protein [Pirellulales bacterium]
MRPHFVRLLCAHVMRVAVVAALAWLVHAEHVAFLGRQQGADLAALAIERVRSYLPEAAAIGGDSVAVAGGREVVAESGERVGTVFKTSPAGDKAIGFSGPTDLLVVCDADLRVAGVEILTSRDTRDHVAAIERDPRFFAAFRGKSLDDLVTLAASQVDAVGGSTLTCLAIAEGLALRLGGSAGMSRFDTAPTLADLRTIFPEAVAIEPDPGDAAVIRVLAAERIPLGWALRTSPAADRAIGYQGPTDAVIGFDATGKVAGVAILATFDNEPYVGYVRDDRAFRRVYRGMTFEEVAGIDPDTTGVEGVSGATMTSQAVARGIVLASRAHRDTEPAGRRRSWLGAVMHNLDGPRLGALGVIATGIITAFTRLRGTWFGRLALPLAVLTYLGFGAGALLSQAQVWGWAQAGVPRGAVVLAALAAAAIVLPATTRKNVYCSHLCAHGAAQQLLVRFAKPRRTLPPFLKPWLLALPWALLALAILTAVFHLPLNLVDLEPFDAYLPMVAGTAALLIFAVSLLASAFWPMAYCRHACPTGALLDHLRLNNRSDRITWRDGLMLGCLAAATLAHWWPR